MGSKDFMDEEKLFDPSRFDLDAGHVALNFTNTADWHASAKPEEELNSYADLAAWGAAAGVLRREEAKRLLEAAESAPTEAARWLAEAITLREAIYRIFRDTAYGKPVNPADLELLTGYWRQAAQYLRIGKLAEGIQWEWELRPLDLGRVLWPVAQSAVELLDSPQRERVGQCQDDRGCGWLFIDTSKNRTRRWCSMDSCGNRAKAMRHYSKGKHQKSQS